jgi:hypothetical protein
MATSGSRPRRCRPSLILPTMAKAALSLIGASKSDRAGVGIVTVRQLEGGGTQPRRATLGVVRRALESADVEFIDENGGGPGVRLRKRQPTKS